MPQQSVENFVGLKQNINEKDCDRSRQSELISMDHAQRPLASLTDDEPRTNIKKLKDEWVTNFYVVYHYCCFSLAFTLKIILQLK